MRALLSTLLLAVATAACGGGSTPPPQPPVSNTAPPSTVAEKPADPPTPRHHHAGSSPEITSALNAMEDFTGEICACHEHDTACAQKVTEHMTKWSQDMAKQAGNRNDKISSEDARLMGDITKRFSDCAVKAMTPANVGDPCGGGANPCSP